MNIIMIGDSITVISKHKVFLLHITRTASLHLKLVSGTSLKRFIAHVGGSFIKLTHVAACNSQM